MIQNFTLCILKLYHWARVNWNLHFLVVLNLSYINTRSLSFSFLLSLCFQVCFISIGFIQCIILFGAFLTGFPIHLCPFAICVLIVPLCLLCKAVLMIFDKESPLLGELEFVFILASHFVVSLWFVISFIHSWSSYLMWMEFAFSHSIVLFSGYPTCVQRYILDCINFKSNQCLCFLEKQCKLLRMF